MRTRAPLIVLALLAVTAAVFCFRAWNKKPDANEESPAVASHGSFWLNAAHHSTCQVEDPLIRDAMLLRLLPYCVRAKDTTLALQILEKVDDKASAHVEYAVAARQSNDMAAYQKHLDAAFLAIETLVKAEDKVSAHVKYAVAARRRNDMAAYRKHLDAAFEIADAICGDDGSYDDRASDRSDIYWDIVSTLIDAGYVEEAVSISLRDSSTVPDCDWGDFFAGRVLELASLGRIADARCIAAAIPRQGHKIQAYLWIAEIQRDDGRSLRWPARSCARKSRGATETLQEALAHVGRSDSPLDKAYGFSLIAAAFAQNGDRTEAVDARTRCHQTLAAVDTDQLQESDHRATAARTYVELAHTSALLEEPEEAKRRLAQADSILAKMADDWGDDQPGETGADIAEVWMCLNEQDRALAVAEAQPNWYPKEQVHRRVITHPSFSATREVTARILAGLSDNWDREYVLMCLVIHHLDHGRVAQAQVLAETIDDGSEGRDWADNAIFDKLCELGAIDQVIDMLPRLCRDDADGAIKKLRELASINEAIDIAARMDDTHRDTAYRAILERLRERPWTAQGIDIAARIDDAYSAIIEKLCELGSVEQAIDIAAGIDDPRVELDVFELIGKTLAKSRTIVELESFLTAQSKPIRLSAAYLGVLEVVVTDAEPTDGLQTDGDSAAPPPDQ